jgi:hypothetical protein
MMAAIGTVDSAAAMAPVPVFETDGSSSTVAAGNPALESSVLMLLAVSLPAISLAAASPADLMRVSTRMASTKRCRRLLMLSILYITTASLATPAACAREALKAAMFLLKADCDIGTDSMIKTSCVLEEADVVVPEVVGGVQSAISSLPDCDIFPAGHWVQVLSDQAPILGEYVPTGQAIHSAEPV